MANNGDQDSRREYSLNTPEILQILFWSPINSEQSFPENQTADKQQLDQPGGVDGFLQCSVNQVGIQQLTELHLGQPAASNSLDQGREQLQALMQRQPDKSKKKRRQHESTPDSHSPEIRQTIPGDKLARKRQNDKRYRDRIKQQKQQTKSDLEKLCTEYGQLNHEYQKMKYTMEKFGTEYEQLKHENEKMKSDMEKFGAEYGQLKHEYQQMKSDVEKLEAENGQLKHERWELKSEVHKLEAENGQLKHECQEMKSYAVELGAENRYPSRGSKDTFRSFAQGFGHPHCGNVSLTRTHQTFPPNHNTHMESIYQTEDRRKSDGIGQTAMLSYTRSSEMAVMVSALIQVVESGNDSSHQ